MVPSKFHSLLLTACITVKWCCSTGEPEMSKNIPLQPCCWMCHGGCQLGNSPVFEMSFKFVKTEVLTTVLQEKNRRPVSRDIVSQKFGGNIAMKEVV